MRVDLHNHTTLCNHATGSIEEYVERANNLGIDIFGFSCHAPMDFDKKYRMNFDDLPLYIQKIKEQKSAHTEILCALEVDYIAGREDLLSESVLCADVDYLIGSVHFLDDWGFDNPEFIGKWQKFGVFKVWDTYLSSLQQMAQSGYFQIVGHFDLPKVFGNVMPYELFPKVVETLEIMRDKNLVLEVNASGLRKTIKEQYPSRDILEKAKELGLQVTLGSDAHSIEHIGFGYDVCVEILKSLGFYEIGIFRKKQKYIVGLD